MMAAPLVIAVFSLMPAVRAATLTDQNKPEVHADILEHFKYGSIGAEERAGIPLWIWAVLPDLFPQHLPQRPGSGWERFGLVMEPGKARPIGTSRRERQIPMLGLNCAVCHTGTLRETPGGPRRVILGMPAHQFDLQSYERFIFACLSDPSFTADRVLPAIERINPDFGFLEKTIYRFVVLSRTREQGARLAASFRWMDDRPDWGRGRVDTFNPYKVLFGFNMAADHSIGTADLPPLFNQKVRDGLYLHWDGNNDLVTERNKSAAIGAGASETSLDLESMKRIEDWIWELKPPPFPPDRIDKRKAAAGKPIYDRHCADCHAIGGKHTGEVIPLAEVETDAERVISFTAELTARMNRLGAGQPWAFSHFRKTDGYAAMPLDGVWLRAPYLHNGSVPTLRALLSRLEGRPAVFWRGYDVYDFTNVGFVSSGPEAEREGFRFNTSARGNGRAGHFYGTALRPDEKDALIEYLKTL